MGRSSPRSSPPPDPAAQDLRNRLAPPAWFDGGSLERPLGTDNLGRDISSRLIYGSRISLMIGLATITLGMAIGAAIGISAGYFGGAIDNVFMRIVDVRMALPSVLLAMIFAAVIGPGRPNLIAALVLTSWPIYTRVVRAEVLSIGEREDVMAARALGAHHVAILIRHILPNALPILLVLATLQLGVTIITEASLSFVGIGGGGVAHHGASVTVDDDAADESRVYEDGLRTFYRGYDVVGAPDAYGGMKVIETLNLLEGFDLAGKGHNRPETIHAVIEAMRLSWADRFRPRVRGRAARGSGVEAVRRDAAPEDAGPHVGRGRTRRSPTPIAAPASDRSTSRAGADPGTRSLTTGVVH